EGRGGSFSYFLNYPLQPPRPDAADTSQWLGGTSNAGLRSKNPTGLSQKETVSTGITGHSSGRVMWWMPKTYQRTTSVSSIGRLAAVHAGRPRSARLWTPNSPPGQPSP